MGKKKARGSVLESPDNYLLGRTGVFIRLDLELFSGSKTYRDFQETSPRPQSDERKKLPKGGSVLFYTSSRFYHLKTCSRRLDGETKCKHRKFRLI